MRMTTWAVTCGIGVVTACSACAQDGGMTGPVDQVGDAPAASGYDIETVIGGLSHPWGLAFLPGGEDGDMLITERRGTLRIVRNGELASEPIAGVPEIFAAGQGGLMDVSLHPLFDENRLVYLAYSTGNRRANRTAIGRGALRGDRLENFEEIFRVSQAKPGGQHFGCRIEWVDDETMLVAIGDGGNPPTSVGGQLVRLYAQERDSHFGKMLRLKDDGTPHPDNPFADSDDEVERSVFTLGHRNVQGIAIDRESGRVYVSEHGARGGDELNLLEAGSNYGWPMVTYSIEYWGPKIAESASGEGMTDPLTVWTPCIAPCGLELYTGDAFPAWRGDLFAGGLIGEQIRVVDLDDDGEVVGQTQINTGRRVRDVVQGPDGYIYFLTDHSDGALKRVVPESGAGGE